MKSLGSLDSSSLAISIRQYKLSKNKGGTHELQD